MKQGLCSLLAVGLCLGMAAQGQGQPTYTFTTLDVPDSSFPDSFSTFANGINAAGQIVGSYGNHGFLFDGGSYTTLDVPGALYGTQANGINASGQIVGVYGDARGTHGFLATPVP